jgi:LemA protein
VIGQTAVMAGAVAVVTVIIAVVTVTVVVGFNRLQRARQGVYESWAQIDTLLQRRFDLVGALAAVVGAAAAHERRTQEAVVAARAGSGPGAPPAGAAVAERDRVERVVAAEARSLLALAEASPALTADTRFRQLSEQLVRTEDDIAASRRYYNGRVRLHNTLIETVPWNLVAGRAGFAPVAYFQLDLDERGAPSVR